MILKKMFLLSSSRIYLIPRSIQQGEEDRWYSTFLSRQFILYPETGEQDLFLEIVDNHRNKKNK